MVLNASYEYLNVTSVKRAMKLLYKNKAEVVETVSDKVITTASQSFRFPSVIRMLYYIRRPFKEVPLTRKNILLRDRYTCQYCGKPGNTVDHVVPRSRGGEDSWTNCVCACSSCNRRKNNRTPSEAGMTLLWKPRRPSRIHWVLKGKTKPPKGWEVYLGVN